MDIVPTSKILITLFDRDLKRLKKEIEAYEDEALLWKTDGAITNSAGNLCLHIIGNLNHFIGDVMGNSGFVRDRQGEFNDKNIPIAKMLTAIDQTIIIIADTLTKLEAEDYRKPYPIEVFKHPMTVEYFLSHLSGHLNYHLGQINYHRRLLQG